MFDEKEINDIDGWLTIDEAKLLYELAGDMPKKTMWCEIGSWKGKSTAALAQSERMGIAIDPFTGTPGEHPEGTDTLQEFLKNTQRFRNIIVMKGTSNECADAVPDCLGLVFIDGEHTYAAVKQDFELYWPKVVPGGYVVIHDVWAYPGDRKDLFRYPEVTQFGRELVEKYGEYRSADRCLVIRK